MAKKKFLDMEGVAALRRGMKAEAQKLTGGLLLPFDGVEAKGDAFVVAGGVPAGAGFRVVWVPEDGGFRAITGGEEALLPLARGEQPEFTVESVADIEDGSLPWAITELTPTAASMSAGLMAGRDLYREQWIEVEASRVVRRDTGAEVDAAAMGLRIYGAWEDLRAKGFPSLWFYPFFTTREVGYAEFDTAGDYQAWLAETCPETTEYMIPAGATVRQTNRLGRSGRVMYGSFPGMEAYAGVASGSGPRVVDRGTGMVWRYDTASGTLVEDGQIGVGSAEIDRIHGGHAYGMSLARRWEKVADKSVWDAGRLMAQMDVRKDDRLPERMPALDLSGCRMISCYPPSPHSEVSAVKEMAWVDTVSAVKIQNIGGNGMVSVPALDFGKVKDAYRAFRSNTVMTTVSMHGVRDSDGYIGTDLPALTTLEEAFAKCKSLLGVPSVKAPNVTNFRGMCNQCYSLVTAPWFETGKATTLRGVFANCFSLANVGAYETGACTDFSTALYMCKSLGRMPRWTFAKATTVNSMCAGCRSLEHAGELDTGNATDFTKLFFGCVNLREVEGIELESATKTDQMFYGCSKLDRLTLRSLPTGSCTLDFSGLTAWGTTEAGKATMSASAEAVIERALESEGTLTLKIPAATWGRWKAAVDDLEGYMAEASVTVVTV